MTGLTVSHSRQAKTVLASDFFSKSDLNNQ
jgi:hypothetical protein